MGPDNGCKRCCVCGTWLQWRRQGCGTCGSQTCSVQCAQEHQNEVHPDHPIGD